MIVERCFLCSFTVRLFWLFLVGFWVGFSDISFAKNGLPTRSFGLGSPLSFSNDCKRVKRPLGGSFSLLSQGSYFASDPQRTPSCQVPSSLLLRKWREQGGKNLFEKKTSDSLSLPQVSFQKSLRSLQKAGANSRKNISFGHFRDDFGFRRTLPKPVTPKEPAHLQKRQQERFLKKSLLIPIIPKQERGRHERQRRLFLGKKVGRNANGFFLGGGLPPLRQRKPVFSPVPPPNRPLYDKKEWPVPWPKAKPSSKQAKWQSKWDVSAPKSKKDPAFLTSKDLIRLMKKARKHIKKDQFYKAIRACKRILRQKPEHIAALRTMGRVQVWLGRIKKARKSYGDLFSHSPGDIAGYLGMAHLESRAGNRKQAIGWYQMYLQHHPNDRNALRGLARAAAKLKNKKLARASFAKILEIIPKDREAKAYLAGRKLKKRRFLSFTLAHRFFQSGRIGQTFEPKFGLRFFQQFMFLFGVRIDLRYLPQTTLFEIFPHGEAIWQPHSWPGFKLGLLLGGSPLATYYPQFMADVNAEFPLPVLKFPSIKLLMGYRFYQFPTRRAHLLVPGILVKLFQFGFRLKYYLNIKRLLDTESTDVLHALFFQVEWQALWWLVLKAGIGWGNFADYLLNAYTAPQSGPFAGTDISENASFFNLGAQFELPKQQFLIVGYRYYQEFITIFPGNPPDYEVFFHTVTLAYRVYF